MRYGRTLIPQAHLRNETASPTLEARGNKCREIIHCYTVIGVMDDRNTVFLSFQGHLEREEAGSHGQDCLRNHIPRNYITGAKVDLGQFPPAPPLCCWGAQGGKGSGKMGQ